MKKRKKIIIIVLIIVIMLFAIGLIANSLIKKGPNETKFNVSEFKSIQELLEYYNCTNISVVNSNETGFDTDIYLSFEMDTIDSAGNTSKEYYENLISLSSAMMKKKNFRMIDKERKLTITVKFRENGTAVYSINGDGKYFENLKSQQALKAMSNEKEIELSVKSPELNTVINNNWEKAKVEKILGNAEKEENNYKIYSKGYSVRTISSKIYNIVFNSNYKNEVFEGITITMNNAQIKSLLGNPNYDNEDAETLIGYRTKDFYVFFSEGEISIYRVEKFDKDENLEFANYFTELNTTGEYKVFLDRLTDLYPDYETYEQKDNYIDIVYPLRGFELILGKQRDNGLYIYGNYQGLITNTKSLDDIKNDGNIPANVYLRTSQNLVFNNECNRIVERKTGEELYREPDLENVIIKDPNIYKEVETPLEQEDEEEFQNYVNKLKENGEFKLYN